MVNPTIKHSKVSGKPAGSDPTRVYGSDWDAVHTITGIENVQNVDTTNASNITSGTLPAARLPVPTAATLGGVESKAAVTHQFLTQIGTDGTVSQAQPAFTDISGSVAATQMPALTGDITTSAGAVATTLATVNSNVGTFGSATLAPQITTNGKGLITAVATVTIAPAIGSITGLGTGIATALGVAVGTAGSPVVNGGALGTPSSGVGTNLTGTAASLTAGHVTTNANLTGDVTSVGNATTLATGNAANLNSGTLLAARMPALTGDVTTTAGAVATTIANNAVTNAKAAQMAAYTIKANNSGSTANAGDMDVTALTAKASPVSADIVLIQDSAASNAFKRTTVGALASAGSVASIDTATGAFTISGLLARSTQDLRVLAAAKSDQTTATSNVLAVTPLHQQDHDSAAKAWVSFDGGTGTIKASYNVSGVTRTSAGLYTVSFTTAFATANYACLVTSNGAATNHANTGTQAAGSIVVNNTISTTGAVNDPLSIFVACFGRQ